jgi:hypothetical protein
MNPLFHEDRPQAPFDAATIKVDITLIQGLEAS